MVNHTPPWTHFLNIELIIQITLIKTQQSVTGFFLSYLGKLAKERSASLSGDRTGIEYIIQENAILKWIELWDQDKKSLNILFQPNHIIDSEK